MGRVSRTLGDIGYKNTEIIKTWLTELKAQLASDKEVKFTEPPTFEQTVYGGMLGFQPRYHVF